MANEVAKKEPEKKQTFSVALASSLNEVSTALPSGFNTTRFVQNAVALMNDNDNLADFAKKHGTNQIMNGLVLGAIQGLDFYNKECYLIPRGNKLDFQKDYKGVVKIIKKYSIEPVEDVYAKLIRDGDEFEEVIIGGRQSFNFKPKFLNNNDIIGAFAVVLYKNGTLKYEVMSKDDIESCRKASKMPNGNSWKNFYGEMAKKTVIHRLKKWIPMEFENPKQQSLFVDEDLQVETDIEKQVANEIEVNANQIQFEDMDDDAEVVDGEIVEEQQTLDLGGAE